MLVPIKSSKKLRIVPISRSRYWVLRFVRYSKPGGVDPTHDLQGPACCWVQQLSDQISLRESGKYTVSVGVPAKFGELVQELKYNMSGAVSVMPPWRCCHATDRASNAIVCYEESSVRSLGVRHCVDTSELV